MKIQGALRAAQYVIMGRVFETSELDKLKYTPKIGSLLRLTKLKRIERVDKLSDDQLGKFYCIV